jgi:hypothetical protein
LFRRGGRCEPLDELGLAQHQLANVSFMNHQVNLNPQWSAPNFLIRGSRTCIFSFHIISLFNSHSVKDIILPRIRVHLLLATEVLKFSPDDRKASQMKQV